MKSIYIILLIICLTGMLLTSCGSSKPCPAYNSVTLETSPVDLPSEADGQS